MFKDDFRKKRGVYVRFCIFCYRNFNRILTCWILLIIQSINNRDVITNAKISIDINVLVNFLFLIMLIEAISIYFTTYIVIQLSKIPMARFLNEIINI